MKLRRQLFLITGSALVIAAIASAGVSFTIGNDGAQAVQSPDPTPDPCADTVAQFNGESQIGMFSQQDPCTTPTEETPPKTHTPTTEPTDEPDPTEPPTTPTVAPPPATNTPSGGAGAGGLQPPNTGTGGDTSSDMQWLLMAGGLVALTLGAGALGFGLRRNED